MVLLNHSLEHILDIDGTMLSIRSVLKKDGFLFIEIPDAFAYVEEDTAPFNFLTFENVLHMTENDLSNLAECYGFEKMTGGKYYKQVSSYPSIYMVLKKKENWDNAEVAFSDVRRKSVQAYIEKSSAELETIIAPLKESRETVILWGIGASTVILLSAFAQCNVKALIDRNPKRQGLIFTIGEKEYAVEAPDTVKKGTIVILSIPYHASIERQIREMGLTNPIFSLA